MIKVNKMDRVILNLSQEHDNDANEIQFDISEWVQKFGPGTITLTHRRKGDKIPYPVNLQVDGSVVTWIISDVDTAVKGYGTAQLMYQPEGTDILAQSAVCKTLTMKSNYEIGSTPDPYGNWMSELTALAGETKANADHAKQYADNAAASEQATAEMREDVSQDKAEIESKIAVAEHDIDAKMGSIQRYIEEEKAGLDETIETAERSIEASVNTATQEAEAATAAKNAAEKKAAEANQQAAESKRQAETAATEATKAATSEAAAKTAAQEALGSKNTAANLVQGFDARVSSAKTDIENKGKEVIATIPEDYSALVGEVSDVKKSLRFEYVGKTSVNLYKKGEYLYGYIVPRQFVQDDGYVKTKPMYLAKGTYIYSGSRATFGDNFKAVAVVSENGDYQNWIEGSSNSDGTLGKVTIEKSGYYEFNIGNARIADKNFMIIRSENFDDFPTEYIPYNLAIEEGVGLSETFKADINNTIESKVGFVEDAFDEVFNVVDQSRSDIEFLTNNFITIGGRVLEGAYRYKITPKKGDVYTFFTTTGSQVAAYVLQDADGSVYSHAAEGDPWGTKHNYDITVSIPKDGMTLSVNSIGGDSRYIVLKKLFHVLSNDSSASFKQNELYGKQIVFDGDSICHGGSAGDGSKGWASRIGQRNKMDWYNEGIGGGTIISGLNASDGTPRHWISTNIDVIGQKYPNLDYLIIEGGTNDADLIGVENLGEISTSTYNYTQFDRTADFTQALEYTLSRAIRMYPTKKIGFIIAHKMGGNASDYRTSKRRKFFDRCKEVCEKYGVPCLDLWYNAHLAPTLDYWSNDGYYMYTDGQHLSAHGYDYVSDIIEAWIRTL